MPLTFYKPNSKGQGSAAAFSFNSTTRKAKTDPDNKAFFLEIIKQTSWNEESKTGSFKGGEKTNIKLSLTEIGGFIRVLKDLRDIQLDNANKAVSSENQTAKFFHQNDNGSKGITFTKSAYLSGTKKTIVYGLVVNVTSEDKKDIFRIGFDINEAETLLNWLTWAQQHIFEGIYSEDKKFRQEAYDSSTNGKKVTKNSKATTKEVVAEDPPATEEEEIF